MKKLLLLIPSIILASFLMYPFISFANIGVGWNATSTAVGYIAPTAINGNIPFIQVPYFLATSTTATSTVASNLVIGSSTMAMQQGLLALTGSYNGYIQADIQNKNGGSSASSDWVSTANNGNDSTYYADFGINGNGGGANAFTNANDAYSYGSDGAFDIGALGSTSASTLNFYVGGGVNSPTLRSTILNNGNFGVGSTTPGSIFSIGGNGTGINLYDNATSTFSKGINLATGCYAISGNCLTQNVGTVTSVGVSTPNSTLSIGSSPITTSGTITADLNLGHSNTWTALQTFNANATTTGLSANYASFGGSATTTLTTGGYLGIGSTTPYGKLSINPVAGDTGPAFVIGSSSATHLSVTPFSTGNVLALSTSTSAVDGSSLTLTNASNLGLGTTSPFAVVSVVGNGTLAPLFAAGTSTATGSAYPNFMIDQFGRPFYGGPKPKCDASCTMVTGNDARFRITTGTSITSTTITFVNSWGAIAPVCWADEGNTGTTQPDASSTPTTVVITLPSALTAKDIEVFCDGILPQ